MPSATRSLDWRGRQDERVTTRSAWIAPSRRGRIQSDLQSLIRRVQDERVRDALACGVDRSTVVDVMDSAERTSWYKQRRAQAYAFPLDALEQGDAIGAVGEDRAGSDEPSTGGDGGEDRQRLGTVTAGDAAAKNSGKSADGLGEPDAVWPPDEDGSGKEGGADPFTEEQGSDGSSNTT